MRDLFYGLTCLERGGHRLQARLRSTARRSTLRACEEIAKDWLAKIG